MSNNTDKTPMRIPSISSYDEAGARQWVRDMAQADLLYHFDDAPADVIHGPTGKPLFTLEEVVAVDAIVSKLYELDLSEILFDEATKAE